MFSGANIQKIRFKAGNILTTEIHIWYTFILCVCALIQLNLTELRTFPNPPAIVTNVSAAVLVLLSPQGRIPKDRSWKASKMVMSKVIFHCRETGKTF